MLPFIFLILSHAIYDKSVGMEFTITGGGKFDADKFAMDIHVEGVNKTSTVNATTTIAPTAEPNITSPATSTPTGTPTSTPATTATATPSSKPTPTNNTASSSPTSTPPTPPAATKTTTTASANNSTTPSAGNKTTTSPGEGANVTNPTPTPGFNDLSNADATRHFSALSRTALQLHNYYRSIHEAPLMTLDPNLGNDAQEYAERVAKNKLLRPEQDFVLTSKNEGENLGFRCSITRPEPAKALRQIMKRWYDEGCKYSFQTPPSDKYSYRHFTQMTWQGSRKLGIGISYGKVNNLQCLYYVARYRPRGNIGNMFIFVFPVTIGSRF